MANEGRRPTRRVERRTGRREGEYDEDLLVARRYGGRAARARVASSSTFPCAASSFATHSR